MTHLLDALKGMKMLCGYESLEPDAVVDQGLTKRPRYRFGNTAHNQGLEWFSLYGLHMSFIRVEYHMMLLGHSTVP